MAGAALGAIAAVFVLDTVYDAGAFKTLEPHFAGTCEKVTGVIGVEDITTDQASGFAYLSSHDRRTWMKTGKADGAIYRYRPGSLATPLALPHDMTTPFHPHGISLWHSAEGPDRLFVVNHPDERDGPMEEGGASSQVEVFDLLEDSLHHIRTVKTDGPYSLNDVAADGPDSFYASIDKGSETKLGRTIESFGRLKRGGIARGNEFSMWRIVDGLTYPNGLQVSADGTMLFVAETTGEKLIAFSRSPDGLTLKKIAETDIDSSLDNLEWDGDGALWIGAHPKALDFVAHAKDAANRSPSQALRVTFDGKDFATEEIYLNDGNPISGSSVASAYKNRLLIGAVFEPFILDCGRD